MLTVSNASGWGRTNSVYHVSLTFRLAIVRQVAAVAVTIFVAASACCCAMRAAPLIFSIPQWHWRPSRHWPKQLVRDDDELPEAACCGDGGWPGCVQQQRHCAHSVRAAECGGQLFGRGDNDDTERRPGVSGATDGHSERGECDVRVSRLYGHVRVDRIVSLGRCDDLEYGSLGSATQSLFLESCSGFYDVTLSGGFSGNTLQFSLVYTAKSGGCVTQLGDITYRGNLSR